MVYCRYRETDVENHPGKYTCTARWAPCISLDMSESEVNDCANLYSLMGFMSPDGKFYYCPYWGHMDEAKRIVRDDFGLEKDGLDAEKFLIDNGYVVMYARSVAFQQFLKDHKTRLLSDAQLQYMKTAMEICPIEEKRKLIKEIIEEDDLIRRIPGYPFEI